MPFYKELDAFMAENLKFLRDYEGDYAKSKIIADPILGYIQFSPIEVYIMDSPIFQRLRYIRQLGLSYLVFPSLNYSRFEHSLGVVGWIDKIIDKIRGNNEARSKKKSVYASINDELDEYEDSLRLAGLLHDIGHCIFSHCSERVLNELSGGDGYVSSLEIRKIFSEHFSAPKLIPFAEILSLAIIGSKRFLNLLTKTGVDSKQNFEKILCRSARIILGLHIDEEPGTVFLGQILSSGLDADKIDYMTREQHYSGIKLEIDLERLLSKLQVFSVKPNRLPRQLEYLKNCTDSDAEFKVLGFDKGGQFAFEEFCIARLALHVKIYLHQKTRIAEAQMERYLTLLSQDRVFNRHVSWLRLKEDIIHNQKALYDFKGDNQMSLFNDNDVDLAKVALLLNGIGRRDLYARAYAFGPINKDRYSVYDDVDEALVDDIFKKYDILWLREKIRLEVKEICDVLCLQCEEEVGSELFIDLPRLINIQQGQESLYFDGSDASQLKWTIPIDKIMQYYQNNRALGYVYSRKAFAHIVALAAEKVFFEKYGEGFLQAPYLPDSVYKKYEDCKEVLVKNDFYRKCPQIKGVSKILKNAASVLKIRSICDSLSGFKSIVDNEVITINKINSFLNQFPLDLQECALDFIGHLRVYNEDLLVDQIGKILDCVEFDKKKICVTSLGGAGDSGHRLGYNMRHFFAQNNIDHPVTINDEVVMSYDCFILYDDNINSGKQLYNIIGELIGEKDRIGEADILMERHLDPLKSDAAKRKLKDSEMYFVYILGFSGIEERVRFKMSDYFGFHKEKIHVSINAVLYDKNKIFSGNESDFDHPKKKDLQLFLEKVGEQLLENDGVLKEKIEQKKLGYAKAEAMVLFPYNVPTMTITAIWYKGIIDNDVRWYPLAERRRRKNMYGDLYDEE